MRKYVGGGKNCMSGNFRLCTSLSSLCSRACKSRINFSTANRRCTAVRWDSRRPNLRQDGCHLYLCLCIHTYSHLMNKYDGVFFRNWSYNNVRTGVRVYVCDCVLACVRACVRLDAAILKMFVYTLYVNVV